MKKQALRVLCPNRHLGFMMAEEESFREGVATKPDYYCCNSGSNPNDPAALGMDTSLSLYQWQKHDLELMLLASREQGVPMIVGSAGDTGSNSRVDLYVNLIQRLAWQHNLPPFKLAYFYSEVPKETIRFWVETGRHIEGLRDRKPLTVQELDRADRILAVADFHPFLKALESGADVIIGGRSDPSAVFAAAALYEGFPRHLAYALGNSLHTASLDAEPLPGNETSIGAMTTERIEVTTMRSNRQESVTAHYNQCFPQRMPSTEPRPIVLEGTEKAGERFIAILEVHDPAVISQFDTAFEWVQHQIRTHFSEKPYQLSYKTYQKSWRFGDLQSVNEHRHHGSGLVIEGIAETGQIAEELTLMGSHQFLSAFMSEAQKRSGTAAVITHGIFPAPPVYRWAIHHALPEDVSVDFFVLHESIVE